MTLTITPPEHFRHAGDLSPRNDDADPRAHDFCNPFVEIDLGKCAFVRPQAALWCAIYLALAASRGARCQLLMPQNTGVCVYLKSLGLFEALKTMGITVDDRGMRDRDDERIILPLTHFSSVTEATTLPNQAFDRLRASPLGAANLTSVVTELFSELALNAVQHSESPVGAYASIQFVKFETGPRFVCTVADGGIGVRASLCKNPALRSRIFYDWDALDLAVRERVSGTGDPHRGIGLYGVSEDVRRPQHSLLLHSGLGSLEITEDVQSEAKRTRLFPGTLTFLAIPT